jgi:hypothetical protein
MAPGSLVIHNVLFVTPRVLVPAAEAGSSHRDPALTTPGQLATTDARASGGEPCSRLASRNA